jgi:Na+/H+-dicarboxylate symporter
MKFKKHGLTIWILIGLVLGVIFGYVMHSQIWEGVDESSVSNPIREAVHKLSANIAAPRFKIFSDIFLSLVKVIVAPLVFSLLLVGLVRSGNFSSMGRIGGKTLLYFTGATLTALVMGLIIVNLFKPGAALHVNPAAGIVVSSKAFNLTDFVLHIFPKNIVDAMAKNDILPIIVFTILFAAGCSALKEKSKIIVDFFDAVAHVMLKVTGYVMYVAPFAVFGAVATVITIYGIGILGGYVKLIACFFGGLAVFVFGVLPAICYAVGIPYLKLLQLIREPMMIAFGTSSSEAAMPKTIEALENLGCSNKVIGFVLPLGYSFNLDGSIMYMTFATVAIAQAYNIDLTLGQQLTMMLMLLVTSKGMAGVPRASLVVIAGMLDSFHIPAEGLSLIIAIDWLLDMGRSATNVAGNAVATAVVSRWEGEKLK